MHLDELALDPASLRVELADGVLSLTKINSDTSYGMSLAVMDALEKAFTELVPQQEVRAVVLDAAGDGFHQGAVMVAELREHRGTFGPEDFREIVERGQQLGRLMASVPKPVIGLARGGARGGGLETLLRCDFLFTLDTAEFCFPEVTLGYVAAWGGTQWAGRMAPMRRAQEILLLGDIFSGREAHEMGLATRSFQDEDSLKKHLDHVLARLQLCAPESFAQTKACLAATWQGPLQHGEHLELNGEVAAMSSPGFAHAAASRAQGAFHNFHTDQLGPFRPKRG